MTRPNWINVVFGDSALSAAITALFVLHMSIQVRYYLFPMQFLCFKKKHVK